MSKTKTIYESVRRTWDIDPATRVREDKRYDKKKERFNAKKQAKEYMYGYK